jgi:hypothetical protein
MGTLAKGGMGEYNEDRPPSDISVLDDSPPGDVAVGAFVLPFQPKKELIFLPGVLGCRGSACPMDIDMDR